MSEVGAPGLRGTVDTPLPGSAASDSPRRPGRPRHESIEQQVLDATVHLLLESEHGNGVTVSAITARSSVSRAAIYRRWSTREELIAAALDSTRSEVIVPDSGDLLADLIAAYTIDRDAVPPGFERLLRTRLVLALEDPHLQRAYWTSHVSRRRVPVAAAIARGIRSGLLRADLDVDAVIDLIAGAYYYQLVVRGESLASSETMARVHAAIRTAWRGMLA